MAARESVGLPNCEAGDITGQVKDQAGAAVPGATVTVTAVATNRQRIAVSGREGVYTAPSLAPGEAVKESGQAREFPWGTRRPPGR